MISKDKISEIEQEIKKEHVENLIRAIIVYGSWARGTNDNNSDIDIFVICKLDTDRILNKIETSIARALTGYETDISIYDSEKFETLLECGSLYLHHIYEEGVIIYVSDKKYTKEYLFGKLREFRGISEDILLYDRMLKQTAKSIRAHNTNYFDINILALLARNTMILICYYLKKPQYGKYEVYETCCELLGEKFVFDKNIYFKLMEYRSYYNRKNIAVELPTKEEINTYIYQVEQLIILGMRIMDINNSIDRLFYLLNDNPGHNFYTAYEVFTDFDRDLYIYLNKYLMKNFNKTIDSITEPFIEEVLQEYEDDDFIKSVCNIITDVKEIKKKSSNYSIDCPDIYSEKDMKSSRTFRDFANDALKFLCRNKFLEKYLLKYVKEDRKTIIDEMQYLREYIREELTNDCGT